MAGCEKKEYPNITCQSDDQRDLEQYKDMQVGVHVLKKLPRNSRVHCQRARDGWEKRSSGMEASRWICMDLDNMHDPTYMDVLIDQGGDKVVAVKVLNM